jgi:hypothetical protein
MSIAVNWGQNPSADRAEWGLWRTEVPLITTSPESGRISPPMRLLADKSGRHKGINIRTDDIECGRLPCPVGSYQREDGILGDFEVNFVDDSTATECFR